MVKVKIVKQWSRSQSWMTWITWMTLVTLSSAITPSTDRCDVAQSRCVQNPSCLPVLRRYLTYCSDLIEGPQSPSSVCWPRCRRTLPLLLDIPDGRSFVGCDCQHNEHCLEQRQRVRNCRRRFRPSSVHPPRSVDEEDDDKATTCSEAQRSCLDEKSCHDALTIANVVCSGVERRGRCDRACRNSLRTLYSISHHGRQLKSCRCDGHSRPDSELCSALRQNTKTLCHRRRSKQVIVQVVNATTPSIGTNLSPLTASTAHQHLLNASIDLRIFQRSGADAVNSGGFLVTEVIRHTTSGSTGHQHSRIHAASAATSHVARAEIKMAAASNSTRKGWTVLPWILCWILSLAVLGVD